MNKPSQTAGVYLTDATATFLHVLCCVVLYKKKRIFSPGTPDPILYPPREEKTALQLHMSPVKSFLLPFCAAAEMGRFTPVGSAGAMFWNGALRRAWDRGGTYGAMSVCVMGARTMRRRIRWVGG
jgi:hypothetical protein